ncbi:hypothetical protein H4R19_004932 [Coemansia spiralis]|nr:hypothetical protein H4R19_004932 [Coemansia spiralis]
MAAVLGAGASEETSPTGESPTALAAPAADTGEAKAKAVVAERQEPGGATDTAADAAVDVEVGSPECRREADEQRGAEREHEIVEEFEYLLEKSQQLFTGLGELPEIGSKHWLPHFQRTFEVYTRLWRFQSQHRALLEKPEHYGLKRWEVGEIASKIGQLYYRYYMRTSETNYLQEAFVFYDAIRERSYFKGEQEVKNSALMIKKLRYYARFIVVCLQLSNTHMMLLLLDEVKALIDVYAAVFNPVDKMEWSLVVKEMSLFMQAMCSPVPTDGGVILPVAHRLVARRRPPADKDGARLRLQEAVVVGNRPKQTKFSDMTLDMHYMLQLLEREPSAPAPAPPPLSTATTTAASTAAATAAPPTDAAPTTATTAEASIAELADAARPPEPPRPRPEELEKAARRTNPHKYMLYLPSISQIQAYLASAFWEIGDQGCVLLYLSSDGTRAADDDGTSAAQHGFTGGVSTARRSSAEAGQDRAIGQLVNTVHPADLVPFTRKPFFLIVESESSAAYRSMPNLFNQPLLCLLSPTEYPAQVGVDSIYTLFLHSPAVAFCVLSQISAMGAARWAELDQGLASAEDMVLALAAAAMPAGARRFLSDDFLRQIIARHVLCCVVLRLHLDFNRPEHWPQASPECFADTAANPGLVSHVRELIALCEVDQLYRMDDAQSRSSSPPPLPTPTTAAAAASPAAASPPAVSGEGSSSNNSSSNAKEASRATD